MACDHFGLLWNSNGELEQLPKVLGLFGLDIRGVVGSRTLDRSTTYPLEEEVGDEEECWIGAFNLGALGT